MSTQSDLLRAIERGMRGGKGSPHAPVIDPLDLLSLPRLKAFARLSRSLHTLHEPSALLTEIVDRAIEMMAADRGLIVMRDPFAGDLVTKVARTREREDIADAEGIGTKTIARALRGEFAAYAGKASPFSRDDTTLRAIACVPLRIRDAVAGAAYLDRRGAAPFSPEDIGFLAAFSELAAIALENVQRLEDLDRENRYLREEVGKRPSPGKMVGDSSAMQEVYRIVMRVSGTDANVLIEGESGTGKELVARAIHQTSSRADGKFVPVHCAAIPETLIESELFGHRRGAFSGAIADRPGLFEEANGGTLFLDEIHAAPQSAQIKLLRALQEREIRRVGDNAVRKINVRVIAAANRPLEMEVTRGTFREDLYFRLAVVTINVPPLRTRKEDVLPLTRHFLAKHAEQAGEKSKKLARDAIDALLAYDFPGNVRELENVLQKASVLAAGPRILASDLGLSRRSTSTTVSLGDARRNQERDLVIAALSRHAGNVSHAAVSLGILRQQLQRLLRRHKLSPKDYRRRVYLNS